MRDTRDSPTFGSSLRAFAIVSVLLFGNLATLVHAMAVRHVTCPEHGELIHLEVAPRDAEGQVGATDQRGSLQEGPSTGGPRPHDHCGICALGRDRIGSTPRAPRAVASAWFESPPAQPVADARRTQTAIYRFAPKTSPPPFSSETCLTGAPRRDGGERILTTLG